MAAKHSERVRLPRGRHVHAVGYLPGYADRVTACEKNAEDGTFLDEDEKVTCPRCLRVIEN